MNTPRFKEVDVLRALLGVWEKTCVHPYKMSLQKFIRDDVPVLSWIAPAMSSTIVESGVVTQCGKGRGMSYRWNTKAGPPTMVMARRILTLTRQRNAAYARNEYQKRKMREHVPAETTKGEL